MICFPEFFFRGEQGLGYYICPEKYQKRLELATNVTERIIEALRRRLVTGLLATSSDLSELPLIFGCIGTMPIGKGFTSKRYRQFNLTKPPTLYFTTKIDNFALIIGLVNESECFGKAVYKRFPSEFDWLQQVPGGGVTLYVKTRLDAEKEISSPAAAQTYVWAIPVNNEGMTYKGVANRGDVQGNVRHMERRVGSIKVDGTESTLLDSRGMQGTAIGLREKINLGVTICLDYSKFRELKRWNLQDEGRDIIFFPSAGMLMREGEPIFEGKDGAVIVKADGTDSIYSKIGRVDERGRTLGVGNGFGINPERIGELNDILNVYRFTDANPAHIMYRGTVTF